ncbi:zinc ribbon domain-containing protein [Streptomyces sp. P17]|uniref:zinc ribbon domain-containing protein n=1 Tax=Streptomyces sp. P17 TaxID=3074716 RepID=UPI0028F41CDD|nr:zinc ribbon domain-containing protein [Streptomyces sp. P17]MDT9700093.1 zinc ribbon domain-containing protein [Streptomyces sp. P17]
MVQAYRFALDPNVGQERALRSHCGAARAAYCGATKAKLPLHVRVFTCDTCGLILDRDENAAHNLVALAAACTTGTGVAGDQDMPRVSKPRGTDRKTRRQRSDRNTGRGGRAGGAILPHEWQKETGDRRQDTEAQLALR